MTNRSELIQQNYNYNPDMLISRDFIEKRPLSYSSLKQFRKSPAHYIYYLQVRKKTPAMDLGSVVDCLVLEPEQFNSRFIVLEKPNLRKKENKEAWENKLIEASKKGLTVIDTDTYITAQICQQSIYDNAEAMRYINAKTAVQNTIYWRDPKTGLKNVSKIDLEAVMGNEHFIVDLKTTNNGEPEQFIKQAAQLDYELQAGGYTLAYRYKRFLFPYFLFLTVETQPPFNVTLMFCDDKYIERAQDEYKGTLLAFNNCIEQNSFKMGYDFYFANEYKTMRIPTWKRQKLTTD